jgi:uncharacterized protein (TIGR03435 family)
MLGLKNLRTPMFERYTERARRVLFFARYEASHHGSVAIEPEHLLLGVIREGRGITARLLARSSVSLVELRQELEDRLSQESTTRASHDIPFSKATKRVLKAAAEEADRLLHNYIGTEHLLLGLLSADTSTAAAIFSDHGLRLDAVRDDLVSLLNNQSGGGHHVDELTLQRVLAHFRARASSAPVVYVVPTEIRDQNEIRGQEVWALRGLALRSALERASSFPPTRIELPAELDTKQLYDYVLIGIPFPESDSLTVESKELDVDEVNRIAMRTARAVEQARQRLMLDGIARHFSATIAPDARAMDVFVLTSPDGPGPGVSKEDSGLPHDFSGGFVSMGTEGVGGAAVGFGLVGEPLESSLLDALRSSGRFDPFKSVGWSGAFLTSASGSGMTLQEYGHLLEGALGCPVVDETGLYGRYTLQMEGDARSHEEFLARLRDELGLVLAPARRDVTFLVMRTT